MDRKCEFFSKCPIAKYFGDMGWNVFAVRYCQGGQHDECSRRKLRLANQPVPEHLLPWEQPAL